MVFAVGYEDEGLGVALLPREGFNSLSERLATLTTWFVAPRSLNGVAARLSLISIVFGMVALLTLFSCMVMTVFIQGMIVH